MVQNLQEAIAAYKNATTHKEEWAAQCQIRLYGGNWGPSGWRPRVAAWVRRLAVRIEGES